MFKDLTHLQDELITCHCNIANINFACNIHIAPDVETIPCVRVLGGEHGCNIWTSEAAVVYKTLISGGRRN